MDFGIYIHIPHCLQRCSYCDFSTYEVGKILAPQDYVQLLLLEMRNRAPAIPFREVDTVYFGGGTPSLVDPSLILILMEEFGKLGFRINSSAEVTLEINPGTIDQSRLDAYRRAGINRFSVGAQSFQDRFLKMIGRKHSSQETRETLRLLEKNGVRYNFDLIFALPDQTTADLKADLDEVAHFKTSHVSAYVLTVPEGHPLAKSRAPEGEQVEMFYQIETGLSVVGLTRYEVSNYAKPGFESRHNLLYWTDQPYWGIGISAHSYFPHEGWGTRFWNPRRIQKYIAQVKSENSLKAAYERLPLDHVERLTELESLTDFCHTSLRKVTGLSEAALRRKYSASLCELVMKRLQHLKSVGIIEEHVTSVRDEGKIERTWRLSTKGWVLADRCFETLTFLPSDKPGPLTTRASTP